MTNSRVSGGLVFFFAWLAVGVQARAAEPDEKARAEAKERFNHGLYLVENGAQAGALAEFERAQELAPSRLFLYHTALVYVAMDKPVEAVESLDEVLSADGTLKSEYVERAKAAKEEQQHRIGELDVKVNVPAAAIEIDGEHAGDAPLQAPLKVAAGEHVIAVIAPGHVPTRQTFSVAGQGRAELVFELEVTEAKLAHVTVQSPLPGAEVRVDDVLVGKTPLAGPVTVLPGKRVFEMQRSGYMSARRILTLSDGAYSGIALDSDEDESAGAPRGRLRLKAGKGDVVVTIDGHSRGVYREPIDLPAGPHVLKLERNGYEAFERTADVPGGDETVVKVSLRSTDKAREAVAERVGSRRRWAITTLVSGALVAGGSTGLALWANGKVPGAESNLALAKQDAAATCDPNSTVHDVRWRNCVQPISDAQSELDKYRNLRLGGFIGAGVGVALVVTGVALLLTGPDGSSAEVDETVAGTLEPTVYAGPGGASLGLRGRF